MIHNISNNQSSQFSDQLKRGFAGLRFSGFIEEDFLSHYAQTNVQRSRLFPILAIGMTLISIGNIVAGAKLHSAMLAYNFLIMLPVLGATLWASLNPARYRIYQFLLAISAALIGMWVTSIVIRASLGGAPYYFSALVAWVFSVWLILGLPFRHAATTALVISGLYGLGGILWDLHLNEVFFTLAMLFFINAIGAFCGYQLEYAVRCTFLDSGILSRLAERDGLTGLYNRRSYDLYVDRIWRQSRREDTQLTIMLIDIDHFKSFNDYYGHQAGDDALKAVANVIVMSAQRPLDFVARYGGEEFSLVLYAPAHKHGREFPEQLRESVRDLKILHADSPVDQYLTVSIGVAHISPGSSHSLAGAIQMADEALYQAKEEGRNRIIINESDSTFRTGRFRTIKNASV